MALVRCVRFTFNVVVHRIFCVHFFSFLYRVFIYYTISYLYNYILVIPRICSIIVFIVFQRPSGWLYFNGQKKYGYASNNGKGKLCEKMIRIFDAINMIIILRYTRVWIICTQWFSYARQFIKVVGVIIFIR